MFTEDALKAATKFMQDKGYKDVEPSSIEQDDDNLWYFIYDLDEGSLELEVEWDGSEWFWEVMDFIHYRDDETLAPSGR